MRAIVLSRRTFLSAGLSAGLSTSLCTGVSTGLVAFLSGCKRPRASGYAGYAFVANQEGHAIAAIDLAAFAVARHIRIEGRPSAVCAVASRRLVYALTPENGCIHELHADTLTFSRKLQVASSALSMSLSPQGNFLYVLCREPAGILRVALQQFRTEWRSGLPGEGAHFDLSSDGRLVAVTHGEPGGMTVIDVSTGRGQSINDEGLTGLVRFRKDSQQLIAANLKQKQLSLYQPANLKVVTKLALAIRPDHFCFNADGGQLFLSGEGADAVVVVYPFYIPEIAETVLAGRQPGPMAASVLPPPAPQYLFVANSASGDVSVLDIHKRKVIALAAVGSDPGAVVLTPDDQYALVLNRGSGDIAVIRIENLTRALSEQRRSRKAPLFMMIPVGSRPVEATVMSL